MDQIPPEIQLHLCSYLDPADGFNYCVSSTGQLRYCALLWRYYIQRDFGVLVEHHPADDLSITDLFHNRRIYEYLRVRCMGQTYTQSVYIYSVMDAIIHGKRNAKGLKTAEALLTCCDYHSTVVSSVEGINLLRELVTISGHNIVKLDSIMPPPKTFRDAQTKRAFMEFHDWYFTGIYMPSVGLISCYDIPDDPSAELITALNSHISFLGYCIVLLMNDVFSDSNERAQKNAVEIKFIRGIRNILLEWGNYNPTDKPLATSDQLATKLASNQ